MKVKPSINDITNAAQKLSRNPLGIIALFIVLVYGIAALVLGISSTSLQANEKLPIIWFLVIFPVIVLLAFYRLVTKHHVKLYAPHDFQDKEGFFRVLTPLEQKKKLEEEIKIIESEVNVEKASSKEIVEKGIIDTISARHAYVLAEELAFREIENEYGTSVLRQVAFGPDYGIDGVFFHKGKPVAIQIKYTRMHHSVLKKIIHNEAARFENIAQSTKPITTFLLVIVTEGISKSQRDFEMKRLNNIIAESGLSIQLRLYDFFELKEKYGVSEGHTQQRH